MKGELCTVLDSLAVFSGPGYKFKCTNNGLQKGDVVVMLDTELDVDWTMLLCRKGFAWVQTYIFRRSMKCDFRDNYDLSTGKARPVWKL